MFLETSSIKKLKLSLNIVINAGKELVLTVIVFVIFNVVVSA